MSYLFTRLCYAISFICITWSIALLSPPATAPASPLPYTEPITHIQASPLVDVPWPDPVEYLEPAPVQRTYDVVTVRALVTACSPQDAIDQAYYSRHGYEGATYNIAADHSILPRGTKIQVPGYMDVSFPDKFWEVDSAGGSIIRRATRRGIIQFDVKYRTEHSALKWGKQAHRLSPI